MDVNFKLNQNDIDLVKFKLTYPKRRCFGPRESETTSFRCVKKKKKKLGQKSYSRDKKEKEKEKKKKKKKKMMDLLGQSTPLESFAPQARLAPEAPSVHLREGASPRLKRGARPAHHVRLRLGMP